MIYKGGFQKNLFNGSGILYGANGEIIYRGGFEDGKYLLMATKEGIIKKTLVYRGSFSEGNYNGEGEIYSGKNLFYRGSFVSGTRTGEGTEYDENGNIVYTDMYEYSWPAVLERITGTKYNNYSRGGMTAREYVQSWADENGFWQWNQAYIIALGNNDSFVFGHPLGSVKDVNADCPQDNGDTFFGNMGKIVSKLKTIEPNARIFVVTPQLRGEACDNDIRYIASELAKLCDMFEFTYLLDMTAHAPVYDAEMRKSFGLGFHPNPMGYYAYALIVGNYIDYIIRSNPQEFATIPFVGTLLKNKDYK